MVNAVLNFLSGLLGKKSEAPKQDRSELDDEILFSDPVPPARRNVPRKFVR